MIKTKNDYTFIRRLLLDKPTISDYKLASSIAKAIDLNATEEMDVSVAKAQQTKQMKFKSNLIIHYTHETRLRTIKKDVHQLWNHTLQQTLSTNIRLIIGTLNNRNTKRELTNT